MAHEELTSGWVVVASVNNIAEGEILGVTLGEHEIALYHLPGGNFYATSNVCTHGQAYLSEGWLVEDCMVECPLHAGCFDVRTGKAMGPPLDDDVATYRVLRQGDDLLIELPDTA